MHKTEPHIIARVAYEANRAYSQSLGDHSNPAWQEASQETRDSYVRGVEWRIRNQIAPTSAQHDAWMDSKLGQGWTYGPKKDPEAKQHPCIVPYWKLPEAVRLKDTIFVAVVLALC